MDHRIPTHHVERVMLRLSPLPLIQVVLIQVVLVLGLRLKKVAITDAVEDVVGHLAKRRQDLESGGPGPLGLEVPAIMEAGVAKEGIILGSDLSKMLQGHGMLSPNNRRECTLGHNASESNSFP